MAAVSGVERFGVQEARQRFPELLVRASKGERLVIQRHRQDLAAIVPLEDAAGGTSSHEAMENLLSLKGSAQKRSACLLYTSPSPRDRQKSRMPSSA